MHSHKKDGPSHLKSANHPIAVEDVISKVESLKKNLENYRKQNLSSPGKKANDSMISAASPFKQENQAARKLLNRSKVHNLKIEHFQKARDTYFVKKILMPYLSSVYFSLVGRGTKGYLSAAKTKQYLNLPEFIGEAFVG